MATKTQAFVPGLLVTKSNGALVLLGNEIFLSFNEKEILPAVLCSGCTPCHLLLAGYGLPN